MSRRKPAAEPTEQQPTPDHSPVWAVYDATLGQYLTGRVSKGDADSLADAVRDDTGHDVEVREIR